jgi:putative ABC transport system permease protein
MGVLMSLGASRFNIIGAIFMELAIVGTVFFGLSMVSSGALAQSMGDGLLSQQLSMNETEQAANFGRGTNAGHAGMINQMREQFGAPGGAQTGSVETIEAIDVSVGAETYGLLFAIGYTVLLAALVLPSVSIMRYQPKEILSGKE